MLTLSRCLRGVDLDGCAVADAAHRVAYDDLAASTNLSLPPRALSGRSVLLAARRQLPAALALVALDGAAGRIVLAPPDLSGDVLEAVARLAEVDLVVTEAGQPVPPGLASLDACTADTAVRLAADRPDEPVETEWVLATSGTTGVPKLVAHTLPVCPSSLTRPPLRNTGSVLVVENP